MFTDVNHTEIEQVQRAVTGDRDYAFIKVTVTSDDFRTYTAELADENLGQRVESGWNVTRAWAVVYLDGHTTRHDLTNMVGVKQYIRGRR